MLAQPAPALAAQSSKLVVIPLENQAYDDIVGSSQAPYLNHLISQGTLFSGYQAVASGSNPNYLAMTSGLMSPLSPPSPNIFQAIDGATGLTWKEFMESMTGTCATASAGNVPGSTDPLYTADHDPAYSYRGNTTCTTNDVPLTSSTFDPANLPSFSYVVPNECNDMHTALPSGQSCPAYFGSNSGTSQINVGDNWLAAVVPSLLAQPNVTVLITWDESEGTTVPWEHIVTLEVGAGVTAGGIDGASYNHFSLEAGLYRYFNLGAAPNAGANTVALPIPASPPPLYAGPPNAITQENSNPGTTNWKISQQADDTNQQIDGYSSATSVNLGQPMNIYVSVNPQQTFTIDFYRLGYYQGLGGRLMLEVRNLAGVVQPACPMDATGMIACNWSTSYQLTVPASWVSGVYLVKLTNAAGYQNYINFVVRDDARNSPLLYQVAFNTYEAYNNWPADVPSGGTLPLTGKSLYDYNSSSTLTSAGTQRANKVSFDRPLSTTDGGFLDYEINTVGWLEQQGFDVSYSSDVDTDLSGGNLLNHRGFISAGHDEYWSMAMYNAASFARDHGVNLGFLGADDVSWQVRYAASASGAPDRVLICYKSATLDPVKNNTATVHFRDPQVGLPEQLLVGETSSAEQLGASNAVPVAYVVQNPSNWVYAGTGAFNGESVPNVIGYEIDSYNSTYGSPTSSAGTYQLLSSSPIVNSNNQTVYQNATIYQAPSGAWVFSSGTIEWGWALYNFNFPTGGQTHANFASPFIQILTANLFNKFSAGTQPLPAAPTNLVAVPSPTSVSFTWTDNDATATYELDRSSDPAFASFIAVSLPAGTTSYTDSGLGSAVYYYRLVAHNANGDSPYVSASAATLSYAALVSSRAGLLAHWRLGEASGATAADTTGIYPGTYVNSPTLGTPGAIVNDPSTSVTFNGSTQRVSTPTIPSAGDFTIEGWTYLTNASVNNNTLYGGSGTSRLMPRPGTGSFPSAAYAGVTLNGTEYALQPNSPSSNINVWVYWVLTRQGGLLTLYRNGVQIAQRSDLPATAAANLNGFIGSQNNGAYYLTGRLQDVALYTQALSAADVRNGYATGLNGITPGQAVLPPSAPGNFVAIPGQSAVTLLWTDSDATSSYVLYRSSDPTFATSAMITLPPGTSQYNDTGLGQTIVYYRLLAANSGGRSPVVSVMAATMSYASVVAARSGLLAHWRLGETSGTTAWDTTGTYNGFYVSSPALGSPGAIGNDPSTSVTFNGTTQRVSLPSLPIGGDFSVEGWSYLTNGSVNNNTLYGGTSVQFLPRPGTGSFPTAAYAAVTLNGTVYSLQPTSPASNLNTWVYWVFTRQGTALTLYRNGVQIAQRTDLPATATTSLSGYIADESGGSYYLTGRVQDVAVYNRALSSTEVANSYPVGVNGLAPAGAQPPSTPYYVVVRSEPSLIAYWRLGESSGSSTAADVLGNYGGTYVSSPTLGSTGAIVSDPNTAVTFNGTTQRVTLPSIPTVGDFTIEGWSYLTNSSVNNNTVYGGASTVQLLARPGTAGFPTAAYAGVTLNGTAYVLQPNSPASDMNTWVYWTLTRQGGTLTLYRNAVQIGQRTDLPASATANISGYIADEIGGLYYLYGGVDEVALYSSALTPQDITSHFQAQFGPPPSSTAPPTVAVTSPINGATYGANWTGSINGTASTNSGFPLTGVSVAVQDTTSGQWWGGSAFNQPAQTFVPVSSGIGVWSLNLAATSLTSGHSYAVVAKATDSVGNAGTSGSVAFAYNTSPPSVSTLYPSNGLVYGANWAGAVSGSASSSSGFALTGVSVAVQDTTTGLWWGGTAFNQATPTYLAVSLGNNNWSLNLPAAGLTSGHGYAVTAQATDSLGNSGSSNPVAFSYYSTPPSTTIACGGAACSNGWYTAPVSVTLAAADPGGPGVSATYYTTDGSTPTTASTLYTGAFSVASSGTVKFRSIDIAGNTEAVNSQTILVDSVAPATTASCNGTACSSGWYPTQVSVTLAATDNTGGSGVSFTFYTTDGSTPTSASSVYIGPITVSSTSTVKFFSVDNAGNAEAVESQQVKILALVSIAVTPDSSTIPNGTSQQFTATGTYNDGTTQDLTGAATWSSSNAAVATVTAGGMASGAAQGATQISAAVGAVSGGTTLTVGPAVLVAIAVTPGNPSIANGTTQQFSALGTYSDGSTQDVTASVTWASANPAVATVNTAGLATGMGLGTAQISATSGAIGGSTALTVAQAALISISVTPANPTIASGTTQQFSATGTYSDGTTQDLTGSVIWSSSNAGAATTTTGGLASGVAQGTSQIGAAMGSISGATTLTVGPAVLVSIAVTPANPSIPNGTVQQFAATGTYSDGSTQDLTGSVTWASANEGVATVSSGGMATGVGMGTSQISATSGAVSGGTTLTVAAAALVSIAVTPANPTIANGTTQQLTATGTYTDTTTQDLTSSATWSSSNTASANVSSGGLATGLAQGASQISAAMGSVSGSTMLTVGPAVLVSIAVTPANPAIASGTSQQFTATGTYTDGSTLDLSASATWASSNSAVAGVSAGGLATGVGVGTSQVSATWAGISGNTTLTVTPATLISISVTPANPTIPNGTSQQFAATGTYSDGSTQDLTGSVSWSSGNLAVAGMNASGQATAVSQGASQISAAMGTISGSTSLTVGPPALVSISVGPANPTIASGTTQQFAATGTYSDGTTQDVTGSATWSSSNTAAATVSATGLATGAAQGASQISATAGAVSGSTTLTVGPPALVSIAVTPANPTIPNGTSQQFTATGTYSDGSTQNVTSSATWSSSNTAAATVSATGLASAVAQGTAQIGAAVGSVSGGTTLTVGPPVLVSIAVTPANPTIPKGATQQFVATGTFSDGSTQVVTGSVTWSSSNTATVTVTATGLATAVALGTSQVSATSGAISGSTTATVGPASLVSIAVTPASATIAQGKSQQYTATGTFSDGTLTNVTNSSTWSTSNSATATITAGGLATGVAQGTTQVIATSGLVAGSANLTVSATVLSSIAVTPANPSIAKGKTQQFTATGTYSDGSTLNLTASVTWASANAAIATISAGGLATGAGQGTSQISASYAGVTGGTTLTVSAATLTSIAVTPVSPSIAKGQTKQFIATGTYSDGSQVNITSSVTWTSSNTTNATIAAGGLATGLNRGSATITAASGGVNGKTTLTVTVAALVSIAVTPANPSIAKGTTRQFTATGTYTDGTTKIITTSVTWSSSSTGVATVSSAGLATGVNLGTAEINAVSSGVTGSTTLTVGTATLVSIAVAPTNPSIAKGATQQFTATGTYSDGSTQNLTFSVTWSSSSTAVASVTAGGLATGVAQGTAQISASTAGQTASTTLTVGPAALVAIAITPANPSIAKGQSQQFHALGSYSDGSTLDLTTSATWASANNAVATISASGLATGAAQGTSKISASMSGVSGSTTLTVGAAKLVSITITPANQSVKVGGKVQYVATGIYSDGTTQDLTASVTWASSSNSIATITAAGLATGVKAGSITISATTSGVTGSTGLTVTN